MRLPILATASCTALLMGLLSACGDAPDPHAGHNHAAGEHDAHAGHNHAPGAHGVQAAAATPTPTQSDHGHGAAQALAAITIGDDVWTLAQLGAVTAGAGAVFSVTTTASGVNDIRSWIGEANGRGSMKSLVNRAGDNFHAHVEAPALLSAKSLLWIAYTNAAGEKVSGSTAVIADTAVATPSVAPAHDHNHGGHDHGSHEGHSH